MKANKEENEEHTGVFESSTVTTISSSFKPLLYFLSIGKNNTSYIRGRIRKKRKLISPQSSFSFIFGKLKEYQLSLHNEIVIFKLLRFKREHT